MKKISNLAFVEITSLSKIALAALLLWVPLAHAEGASIGAASGTATEKVAPQPNDESDWTGDSITLRSDFQGIKAAADPLGKDYFSPDGAVLDVAKDDKSGKLRVKFRSDSLDGSNACTDPSFFVPCGIRGIQETSRKLPDNIVDGHGSFLVDKVAIENAAHLRRGFTFGALLVPFKYQLSDKSFSGSTTIEPYIGYKFQDNRGSITPVFSAGLVSNIKVPLANGGGTVDRSGISLATGVIFSIDKGTGIQIGILFGQDRLGSNAAAPYQYEGKTWTSVSIGWKFI
ncbi:MAG: hypothetical protein PHU06_14195 [Gallionella sp.]|nr:hypothetical protein [Gallionella sp.]MDD4960411.1 hypothetical protein [Gallionella sp.]